MRAMLAGRSSLWNFTGYMIGLALLLAPAPESASAQAAKGKAAENQDDGRGVQFDKKMTYKWRAGVKIRAVGNCGGMFATVPVPFEWPEQTVRVVNEEVSNHVKRIEYRSLEGGVRQMLIDIPMIPAGDTAVAIMTFEVTRAHIVPPTDTTIFKISDRLPPQVGKFLAPSPFIESRHPTILKLSKEVLEGKEDADAWTKVETIYDYVRANVEYLEGPLKGALQALKDKKGDCEELTSLFIALCRANKIPARTVWVPDHCYPEFYLVDDKGKGHWIPCQAAGARSFGGIPEFRPVLQKGDNFKVPEKKEPQRYVAEFLKGKSVQVNPQVEWIRELLAE